MTLAFDPAIRAAGGRAPRRAARTRRWSAYHDEEWGTPFHDDARAVRAAGPRVVPGGPVVVDDPPQARRVPGCVPRLRSGASSRRSARPTSGGSWPMPGSSGTGRRSTRRSATPARCWRRPRSSARSTRIWRCSVPGRPPRCRARPRTGDDPGRDAAARRAVARSAARGFRFVGSTIVYAFMQSVGLVDDHLAGCFRYRPTRCRAL